MPTYDYECSKCGHRFEVFHSMSDETQQRCPKCKGKAKRVPSAGAGLLFKGSGFYITDYRSASYQEKARQDHAPSESTAAKGSEGNSGASSGDASASAAGTTAKPAAPSPPPSSAASSKGRSSSTGKKRSKRGGGS